MIAEFEADLARLRTREGMKVVKAKGRLRGKQPKLKPKQETHLVEVQRETPAVQHRPHTGRRRRGPYLGHRQPGQNEEPLPRPPPSGTVPARTSEGAGRPLRRASTPPPAGEVEYPHLASMPSPGRPPPRRTSLVCSLDTFEATTATSRAEPQPQPRSPTRQTPPHPPPCSPHRQNPQPPHKSGGALVPRFHHVGVRGPRS